MRYGGTIIGSAKITRQHVDRLHIEHTSILYDGKQAVSSAAVWRRYATSSLWAGNEWFECPRCPGLAACSTAVLASAAGDVPGSIYLSQAAPSSHARTLVGAQKTVSASGGSGNVFEPFPCKPRTMHWKTYRKLKARHDRLTGWPTAD